MLDRFYDPSTLHLKEKTMENCDKPAERRIGRVDLFWLAYLVFFFIDPLLRRSPVFWAESIAVAGVFIAMYVAFLRLRRTEWRVAMLLAIYGLGAVCYPFNTGSITFFIYVAALLPFVVASTARVVACFVAEILLILAETWMLYGRTHPNVWYNSVFAVFFVVVVGGSNVFFAQKQRAARALRMAHEEIQRLAAVAERERIARDLHDVLGHTLSVIVLKAELAKRLMGRMEEAGRVAAEVSDIERIARSALADVRETIGGYRTRGLMAEMACARDALSAAGVACEVEGSPSTARLAPGQETVLALTLREAVTNVVRHANASHCRMRFALESGHHLLLVEDDGRHPVEREGNGLRGMRERIELMGGTLRLQRDRGTRLQVELPATQGAPR